MSQRGQAGTQGLVSHDLFSSVTCYLVTLQLCPTGVPDCSEEDLSVARALSLSWTTVLDEDVNGTQTLINSDEVTTVDDHHTFNTKSFN